MQKHLFLEHFKQLSINSRHGQKRYGKICPLLAVHQISSSKFTQGLPLKWFWFLTWRRWYRYVALQSTERLLALNLTILVGFRIRGELIETYKINNVIIEYGQDVFHFVRSGNSIISRLRCDSHNLIKKLRRSFIWERFLLFWNRSFQERMYYLLLIQVLGCINIFIRKKWGTIIYWEQGEE